MLTLGWSDFAKRNHLRSSGHSYTSLSYAEVVERVLKNWSQAIPGTGETTLERKVLVPVDPQGFFCPPRVPLVPGMQVQAEIRFRQEGEDPFVLTYVTEDEARRLQVFQEVSAKQVNVVCYNAEALLENGGSRSTDCDWEIVCLLASSGESQPMEPLTMARNFLEKTGGTKSIYTAEQFAESIYYWSTQRGISVRLRE